MSRSVGPSANAQNCALQLGEQKCQGGWWGHVVLFVYLLFLFFVWTECLVFLFIVEMTECKVQITNLNASQLIYYYISIQQQVCSWNVHGIHNPIKRKKILCYLKKVQIAMLQETHLTDLEQLKLKKDWVGQIYYASFNSRRRGVAILVHKSLLLAEVGV